MSRPPTRAEVTGAMVAGNRARREGARVTVCPWSIRSTEQRERLLAKSWVAGYSHGAPHLPDDPADAAPPEADQDVREAGLVED